MQSYIRFLAPAAVAAILMMLPASANEGGGGNDSLVPGGSPKSKRAGCENLNDLKYKVTQAEGNLQSARSNLSNAIEERDDARRMKRARAAIVATQENVVEYTARLAKARAARKAAKDKYDQARRACL